MEVIGARHVRAGIEPGEGRVIRAMWDGPTCVRENGASADGTRNGASTGGTRIQADEQSGPGRLGASLPDLLMAVKS
jgi:hypothetical protein